MSKGSNFLFIAFRGMGMGMAEVVPGVSGGTIAFITGIYERLINAIKSFHPRLLKHVRKAEWTSLWKAIDGWFLLPLLTGMFAGIVIGAFGIEYLRLHHPNELWGFFFGLILASCVFIGRKVEKWTTGNIIAFLLASAAAYWITIATPAGGSINPLFLIFSGMIAISALLLPGISGSFILLLMGMYTIVIPALKSALQTLAWEPIKILFFFGVGCTIGLVFFSRLLSWTFKHYKNLTLSVLTGFMLGSLNKIWPWRNTLETRINSHGEEVPFLEKSVLPNQFIGEPHIYSVACAILLGLFLIYLFARVERKSALA